MKTIHALLIVCLGGLIPLRAVAQQTIHLNEPTFGSVAYCATQEKAEEILAIHNSRGLEAAMEVFSHQDSFCTAVMEVHFIPMDYVATYLVEGRRVRIITILFWGSPKIFYAFSYNDIAGIQDT